MVVRIYTYTQTDSQTDRAKTPWPHLQYKDPSTKVSHGIHSFLDVLQHHYGGRPSNWINVCVCLFDNESSENDRNGDTDATTIAGERDDKQLGARLDPRDAWKHHRRRRRRRRWCCCSGTVCRSRRRAELPKDIPLKCISMAHAFIGTDANTHTVNREAFTYAHRHANACLYKILLLSFRCGFKKVQINLFTEGEILKCVKGVVILKQFMDYL